MTNQYCSSCQRSHNGLNGRYCNYVKRYVEYAKTPPCSWQNQQTEE